LTELPDGHSKRREIVPDILEGLKELDEYALIKIDLATEGRLSESAFSPHPDGCCPCPGEQQNTNSRKVVKHPFASS
jgi:hypothetical protein